MPTTTDVRVNDLIINKMTQEQYDALPEKSPTELYVIEGDSNVIYAEQAVELPTAGENNLGRLFQYVGTTTASYINGYFYKCVSDGLDPATYSWQQVNVQPAVDPLPSQTGNAGKFLTTDGTDASWSDKPLINKTTANDSLQVTIPSTYSNTPIKLGSVAVGSLYNVDSQSTHATGFGIGVGLKQGSTVVGNSARQTNGIYGTALGNGAYVGANGAIQFGKGTNSEAGTVCFGLTTNASTWTNYKLLDSNGIIPEARLADTTSATQGQVLQLDSNNNAVWADVDSLPSQSGQNGKILGTDGTNAAWETKTTVSFRTWGINE